MRLFTAISLPDAVSNHLNGALGGVGGAFITEPGAGLRWVPSSKRHITLAFHGEVPDGSVPGFVTNLHRAVSSGEYGEVQPFELALGGSGTFMDKTLWVGVGSGVERVRALSSIVAETATDAGFRPDNHAGGRPHVTIARASSHRGPRSTTGGRHGSRSRRGHDAVAASSAGADLGAWARALAIYRGSAWTVNTIQVMESRLGQGAHGGPIHTEIAAIPLGGYSAYF